MREPLEDFFPGLAISGYGVTSEASTEYNCIAWARNNDTEWWDYSPTYRWLDSVPRSPEVEALVALFVDSGYTVCNSDDKEAGFDKVAIYTTLEGLWTHATRQLDDGQWTSKLGAAEDIYGIVHCIVRRPIRVNGESSNK